MTAAPSILFVILPLMLLFYATVSIGTNVLRSTLSLETGAALANSFVVTVIALMIFGVRIMILRGAEKSALVARRRAER